MCKFQKDLKKLLNEYSKESGSNTPDFILAKYLKKCLETFNEAIQRREEYYGRKRN